MIDATKFPEDRTGRVLLWIAAALAVSLALFHLYTAWEGPYTALQQRITHISGILGFAFLTIAASARWPLRVVMLVLVGLVTLPALYLMLNFREVIMTAGMTLDKQIALGAILIAATLIATYFVLGLPLLVIACTALAFAFFGHLLPSNVGHVGYSVSRITAHLYLTTEGILGTPIGACATYIFLFILFSAILEKTGMGAVFIGLGHALTGRRRGGPAYVAVTSSALFGSINGSAVANVASTGTFTIPLMIRAGYARQTAAAIEAAASSGGQIMPPIMGAAAFLMASFTGIPYIQIAWHALFPALLYFGAIFAAVQLGAHKYAVGTVDADEMPSFGKLLKTKGYMLLPIPVLIFFLMQGYTPFRSGFYAIGVALALSLLSKETRLSPPGFVDLAVTAMRNMLPVAVACACAGIVIGVLTLTGLGLKLSGLIVDASGGSLFAALVITAFASIVLGMGLPTVGVYLLLSVLVAPALVQMGVPLIAAHMFIFYFGLVSAITPPVALAAYAAAAISGSKPLATSVEAFMIGLSKVVVPFVFVYGPELLMIGTWPDIAIAVVSASLGVYALAIFSTGWWNGTLAPWRRGVVGIGATLMLVPGGWSDVAGLPLILAALYLARSTPAPVAEAGE